MGEKNLDNYRKRGVLHTVTKRNCLRCDAAFMSDGAHNRLCTYCRDQLNKLGPVPTIDMPVRKTLQDRRD